MDDTGYVGLLPSSFLINFDQQNHQCVSCLSLATAITYP